jgi:hypothetical protein
MSEIWPHYLITAYVLFLLGSFFKFPSLLAEELKVLGWYLAVGLLVAVWTHDIFVFRDYQVSEGVEINLFGLFRKYWSDVVRPFSLGFMILSMPRLLILFFLDWRRRKRSKKPIAE